MAGQENESVNGSSTLRHAYSLGIKKGESIGIIKFIWTVLTESRNSFDFLPSFIIVSHHHNISKTGKRLSFFAIMISSATGCQ